MADMIAMLAGLGAADATTDMGMDESARRLLKPEDYIKQIESANGNLEKIRQIAQGAINQFGEKSPEALSVTAVAADHMSWISRPMFGVTGRVPGLGWYWTSPKYVALITAIVAGGYYYFRRR